MSETILPCPHCGGEARKTLVLPGGFYRYGCGECAIYACNAEDWNRRTPGPETEKVIEAVREWLEDTEQDEPLISAAFHHGRAFIAEHEPAKPEAT